MGAWGEGMRSNDTALDYISTLNGDVIKAFRGSDAWTRDNAWDDGSLAILGMAQHLLDKGFKIPEDLVPKVKEHVNIQKRRAKRWSDQELRVTALNRFLSYLEGKAVDAKALAADNEGLLSKMAGME
jgi:hypothetical protein